MKRIYQLTIGLLLCITAIGQAPQLFNYQGIVRQASGNPVANKKISLRISILDGSAIGKTVYSEIQQATTNSSGLYSIAIGSGQTVSGTMKEINWGIGDKFINVEIDTDGGNRYTSIGTAQLLSVPFALYAANGPGISSKESLAGTYWETTGNSGTTPGTNFLGTTDNVGLVFKTNNELSGFLDPAKSNVALGTHALNDNKGRNLVAIGDSALYSQANNIYGDYFNTAVGSKSLYSNSTGSYNTAVGYNAARSTTTGYMNTGIGSYALYNNTTGVSNTAVGRSSLYNITTGSNNTAVGVQSLLSSTTGFFNSAVGFNSLAANTTGWENTATGNMCLEMNSTGSFNTATGSGAMKMNTTGNYNTATGIHALLSNDAGEYNTAIGSNSLYFNTGGYNTAVGADALYSNTSAFHNAAFGSSSLYSNTTGYENVAIGSRALELNTTGTQNSALGSLSLSTNTTGDYNTSIGSHAMINNITGYFNSTTGFASMHYNTTGSYNAASGTYALYGTTTGSANTGTGYISLMNNTTGSYNTAIGYSADVWSGNLTNATAVGASAIVDASNKVRIGNTGVTSIGGQVGWTTFSDGRYKTAIQENIAGLDFILKLRPVSYLIDKKQLDNKYQSNIPDSLKNIPAFSTTNDTRYTGFIAQEVEAAAKQSGFDFSGIDKPTNENALYGLRYAEFVVPLVKAVQEQQAIIESLKKEIATLKQLTTNR